MDSDSPHASLDARDVAAAWLLCLAVAALAVTAPTIATAPHGIAGATRAGLDALRHAAGTLRCAHNERRAGQPAA